MPETLKRPKKAAPAALSEEEVVAQVRQSLSTGSGLGSAELGRQFATADRLRGLEAARHLAARGVIHRIVLGRAERFFLTDPIATLDRVVPELLRAAPLTAAQLKPALERVARGHGPLLTVWLKSAVARGIIFEQAPRKGARGKAFGHEPDLRVPLKKVLVELAKAASSLERLGATRERVLEVLRGELGLAAEAKGGVSNDSRGAFLEALRRFAADNPRGALLPVRELRERAGLGKQEFDAAALALSQEGLLVLHHHDHSASLSEADQNALVRDGRGTHYVGIALRGSA